MVGHPHQAKPYKVHKFFFSDFSDWSSRCCSALVSRRRVRHAFQVASSWRIGAARLARRQDPSAKRHGQAVLASRRHLDIHLFCHICSLFFGSSCFDSHRMSSGIAPHDAIVGLPGR